MELKKILQICDIVYCKDFAANLVLFCQLRKYGIWWDNRPNYNQLQHTNFSTITLLEDHYDQFILEYIPEKFSRAAFFT